MSKELHRWRKESRKIDPVLWARLAELAGTSAGYLNEIAYGNRTPSPRKARAIADATQQIPEVKPVTKESLLF